MDMPLYHCFDKTTLHDSLIDNEKQEIKYLMGKGEDKAITS